MLALRDTDLNNRGPTRASKTTGSCYLDWGAFLLGGGFPGPEADSGAILPVAGEGVASFVGAPSAPPVSVFPVPLLPDMDDVAPVPLGDAGVA
jgi:hypothetical protein